MLKRNLCWQSLLHCFLLGREATPFLYGLNDCALFSCDAIEAMTGVDVAAEYRGKYKTAIGAQMTIHRITGGSTVEDAAAHCARQFRMPEISNPAFASRGDWAVVQNGDAGIMLGIVHLSGKEVVTVGDGGLVRLSTSAITRAWKV